MAAPPRFSSTAALALALLTLTPRSGSAQAGSDLPAPVAAYLDSAVARLRTRIMRADTVDWRAFRAKLGRRARGAEEPVDTYAALRWGLKRLNPHSFLQLPDSLRTRERERHPPEADASAGSHRGVISPFVGRKNPRGHVERVGGRAVGVVEVPGFAASHRTAFADSILAILREQDEAGSCGWVLDLRGNTGGNMWPMLAGLGPLLGDGRLGEFRSADGSRQYWYHQQGTVGLEMPEEDEPLEIQSVSEPWTRSPAPPVAVLFDGGTASSGEAVAIAFLGRPHTRSFGVNSFGFTTANEGVSLPDGANMVVTVSVDGDRRGFLYHAGLHPDMVVHLTADGTVPEYPPERDLQLAAAAAWVAGQATCRTGGPTPP